MSDTGEKKDMICVRCSHCEISICAPLASFPNVQYCPNCNTGNWTFISHVTSKFSLALDDLFNAVDNDAGETRLVHFMPGDRLNRLIQACLETDPAEEKS